MFDINLQSGTTGFDISLSTVSGIVFVHYDDYYVSGAGSTIANNTSLNTTTGNLLVAVVQSYSATDGLCVVTGVADTAGNTYTKAVGEYRVANSGERVEIWYAKNITGNASNVTTVTFTGSVTERQISVSEYSGASITTPLLEVSSSVNTSTTSLSSGNVISRNTGDLIVAGFYNTSSSNITKGTDFFDLSSDIVSVYSYAEYKILGVAGSYSAVCTTSVSTDSIAVSAVFAFTGGFSASSSPSPSSSISSSPSISSSISSSPSLSSSISSSPSFSSSISSSPSTSSSISSSPSSSPSFSSGVFRTGSPGSIQSSANTGSQSVNVPSDAEIMVVIVSGYTTVSNFFAGGSMTLNSSSLSVGVAQEDGGGNEMIIFYIVNPSTGSQTLAWDWLGTTAPSEGAQIMYAFYKGIDTSNPIRSTGVGGGVSYQASANTGTMTAVSGDMAVAGFGFHTTSSIVWTNATAISSPAYFNSNGAGLAEASLTGDVNISASATSGAWAVIAGVVLRQNQNTYYSSFTKSQTTPFTVSEGGTGHTSLTNKGVLIGAGTGDITFVTPGASGYVLKSDGNNWSSGGLPINDRSIDYEKLGLDFTQIINLGSGTNVDWSLGGIYTKTLTENTTLTFSNFKINKSILLKITGDYSLTLPPEVNNFNGTYDGTVINYIYLHCTSE